MAEKALPRGASGRPATGVSAPILIRQDGVIDTSANVVHKSSDQLPTPIEGDNPSIVHASNEVEEARRLAAEQQERNLQAMNQKREIENKDSKNTKNFDPDKYLKGRPDGLAIARSQTQKE